ncbi:MAG TPA: hypothetical protein PLB18_08630 [Acidobacteriota bacterium]|nr:hypothetical protein [Acidobacteriota bacterium]HNJ40435.1 hypothetical protein [Acidobacteriota bacterium]
MEHSTPTSGQYCEIESVLLGSGRLVLLGWREPISVYYSIKPSIEKTYILKYQDEDGEIEISSLVDLKLVVEVKRLNLVTEISGRETTFATIFSYLFELGQVIRSVYGRFGYLEDSYKIPLQPNRPRLEDAVLRFLAIPFSLEDLHPPMWDIFIDLNGYELKKVLIGQLFPKSEAVQPDGFTQ